MYRVDHFLERKKKMEIKVVTACYLPTEIKIVRAVRALNEVTISWLSLYLTSMGELNRRKIRLKLFIGLEIARNSFLQKETSLHELLVGIGNQNILQAVKCLKEVSYPLFAEEPVQKLKPLFVEVAFPSIGVYIIALQQLQDAIINIRDVLVESYEHTSSDSVGSAVELNERSKTDTSITFTEEELGSFIKLWGSAELTVVRYIRDSLDPQIERLEDLKIKAEK